MTRPWLWWLRPGEEPAFRLDALGRNLLDLQLHLESDLDADERARTLAAIDWHTQSLAGWAFGEYLGRAGFRDLPVVPVPPATSGAVWVDAPLEDGRGRS
jgi:hypothetical protein